MIKQKGLGYVERGVKKKKRKKKFKINRKKLKKG